MSACPPPPPLSTTRSRRAFRCPLVHTDAPDVIVHADTGQLTGTVANMSARGLLIVFDQPTSPLDRGTEIRIDVQTHEENHFLVGCVKHSTPTQCGVEFVQPNSKRTFEPSSAWKRCVARAQQRYVQTRREGRVIQ